MANGKSTGTVEVVDGGAAGSAKALRIAGEISAAVPYAWSGAMWSPGAEPMQPGDLSSKTAVAFRTRGDGGTYRLMAFTQAGGMMPIQHTFTAPAEWTDIEVTWAELGMDGKGVMAIMFVGGPKPGPFDFLVDDVWLR